MWSETVFSDSSTATRTSSEGLTRYYNTRKVVLPVREANSDHQLYSPHYNIRRCVHISLVLNRCWRRVGIATVLKLDGPEVDSQSEIFSSPNTSRSALRTIQPPLQWVREPPLTSIYFTFCKVKTGKVFPVHSVKAYRGSRGITPLILKLCTWWR